MGTKKLVHEFIYHPNVFRNLNVAEAIYAAKKPRRFGTVLVKMLDIPHLAKDTGYAEIKMEKETFNLHAHLNSRQTE